MKLLKKLFVVALLAISLVAFASCDSEVKYDVSFITNTSSKIETQSLLSGELCVKPEDPVKHGYTFIGWFTDIELKNAYDFSTPVVKSIKLYAGFEPVAVPDEIEILASGATLPVEYVEFINNKKEKTNKKTEFIKKDCEYLVGDDNAFSVKPVVTFIEHNKTKNTYKPISVTEWEYEITYKCIDLDSTDLSFVDSIDKVNATIDFSENAIGHQFEISISTKNINSDPLVMSVVVTDGYNVTKASEIIYTDNRGVYDNSGDADYKAIMDAFKEANGLKLNYYPSTIILHKDINITTNDLPKVFFYQEDELSKADSDYELTLGSTKDNVSFYKRVLRNDDKFCIEGNYFTLNIEQIPVVTRESGQISQVGTVVSHTEIFMFVGSNNETAEANIRNMNVVGNAPRVEDNMKAGGAICFKHEGLKGEISNVIASSFFITFFTQVSTVDYVVDSCKAYDSFNSFVYNWGSKNCKIMNSEMIGCGGPCIIQDHVRPSHPADSWVGESTIINSKLESYVAGSEGWFTVVNASSLVPNLKALDALFTPFGKSFLKTDDEGRTFLNFIIINKSGSAEGPTSEKIKGSFTVDELHPLSFGSDNPDFEAVLSAGKLGFETTAGGCGYTDGATGTFSPDETLIVNPLDPVYNGDYLAIYYTGMMIVVGFGPAGEAYVH